MLLSAILLFVGTASASITTEAPTYCPQQLDSHLCTCFHGRTYIGTGTQVTCLPANNKEILYNEIQNYKSYHIDSIRFINIQMPYLPSSLFNGTSIYRMYIDSSTLEGLHDARQQRPSPFAGLEMTLKGLYISRAEGLHTWYWMQFANMTALQSLQISSSPFGYISDTFSRIGGGSLEDITVEDSSIYHVHPLAFQNLKNLKSVVLAGNYLSSISRSVFPNPANKLVTLNFRDNHLSALPRDMFSNMPVLLGIDLSSNDFIRFEISMFAPVWNNLEHLYLIDNSLECGCSLVPFKQHYEEHKIPPFNDMDYIRCRRPEDDKELYFKDFNITHINCNKN